MEKVKGRTDDMLIIRGVNVFPSQIETVLLDIDRLGPHYEIVVTNEGWMDKIEVKVEIIDDSLLEKFSLLEELQQEIVSKLRTMLSIESKVTLVGPNSLKRFQGKAQRVTDLRNK